MKLFKHTVKLKDIYNQHPNIHYVDSTLNAVPCLFYQVRAPLSSARFHDSEGA